MTPFDALYGRRCRFPIRVLLCTDLVCEALENVWVIRDRLKAAQIRQKSYAYNRKRDLEFEVGDLVYLKISPMKGVMRFVKKGKLSHWYAGPYEILKRVGKFSL